MGLGEDPSTLKWYVQAELVHCRFAMAAVAGILFTDVSVYACRVYPSIHRLNNKVYLIQTRNSNIQFNFCMRAVAPCEWDIKRASLVRCRWRQVPICHHENSIHRSITPHGVGN